MRQIFFAITFAVTLIFVETCAAQDVWVAHWNAENIDVYAMDDTIDGKTMVDGKWFKVSAKFVRSGRLQKIVNWSFQKYMDDMWRYRTSDMDGSHVTVVIPRNGLFEFCMDKLGWSYTTDGHYYY